MSDPSSGSQLNWRIGNWGPPVAPDSPARPVASAALLVRHWRSASAVGAAVVPSRSVGSDWPR